ncbi:hypothetical protein I350_05218 [Cryptococcus amylolentus CBS 6273]|nr:hypothetical protein I350_05218 [Cryptococcus amylolentus CBS 6273]
MTVPNENRPRSMVFEASYDFESAANLFPVVISLYVDPNETNPPYSVDEAIGATWASIVHDDKQESPIRVYPVEMERFTSWAQPGSDAYYGMVPTHRPLMISVHDMVESEPVNREFVVEGRLIKCFTSRLENLLPRSVHLYRRLLPLLSAQPQSAAVMVLRKSNAVDDLGGLEAIDLAYKSTVLLGDGHEGMSMILRSWFRDMENKQVAASSDKPENLGAAASNALRFPKMLNQLFDLSNLDVAFTKHQVVISSGLIGAALGEEDMRFFSDEAELAHELPPVAIDLTGTNALSPHDGLLPGDD